MPPHLRVGMRAFSTGRTLPNRRRRKRDQYPTFESISNLHQQSKLALKRRGFLRMTEIQSKTWEHALQGKDILARACTGTGKTLVSFCRIFFVWPFLLYPDPMM